MNGLLLNRSLGAIKPTVFQRIENTRQQYALQFSNISFNHDERNAREHAEASIAHVGGVNAITIDPFEGKYLLSGGADSSISLWDVENCKSENSAGISSCRPINVSSSGTKIERLIPSNRSSVKQSFGITFLSFYPFDSLAFLSSSYDHKVKIHDSETLQVSASFDLDAVVYSHALSTIASHLLVATATQHPTVRLIDLRSGASTHSLAGFGGAVLSVAWSPVNEHVLAGGATDGVVRLWDIRKASSSVGVLDANDSSGITNSSNRRRERVNHYGDTAHKGPVNGIVWTGDGRHIITTGHDERVRVWKSSTGANTLISFGPVIKNAFLSTHLPLVSPDRLGESGKELLFYPTTSEILVFELFEGTLLKRLKAQSIPLSRKDSSRSKIIQDAKGRPIALSWRAHTNELYSAHSDGTIRAWVPRTNEDAAADEDERAESDDNGILNSKKRKREILEEIYRGFSMGNL